MESGLGVLSNHDDTTGGIMPRDAETTHRIMSAVKARGTTPETALARSLWKRGLRYRKHYPITGRPDLALVKARIAIFCDGDFWHGNNWRIRGLKSLEDELTSYTDFWAMKIRRNIERDRQVSQELSDQGWLVLRFWESDIRKSVEECADKIVEAYQSRR